MDFLQILNDTVQRSQDRKDAQTKTDVQTDAQAVLDALAQDDAARKAQAAQQQMMYVKMLMQAQNPQLGGLDGLPDVSMK